MVSISIKIGEKEVVASGTVTVSETEEVSFHIDDLILKIGFEGAEGDPRAQTDLENNILRIRLINFNNPVGTSLTIDQIAALSDRSLGLAMTVHTVGSKKPLTQLLSYSLFLGSQVNG